MSTSSLQERIARGDAGQADAEWLEYLDGLFAEISIHGFLSVGMEPSAAREFIGLLAMTRRVVYDATQKKTPGLQPGRESTNRKTIEEI